MRREIEQDDVVVLPSGRRALVLRVLEDGRVEFAYINDRKPDLLDLVSLPPQFARPIERGIVPTPYRTPDAL